MFALCVRFYMSIFFGRFSKERKKDKRRFQSPFLLLCTDVSVVIMWISSALFEEKIKGLAAVNPDSPLLTFCTRSLRRTEY